MRYLDLANLSLTSSDPIAYAEAIAIQYDSTNLPDKFDVGDVVITGPWGSEQWAWLPKYVAIEIVPDGGAVKRIDPLVQALRERGISAAYAKKPPSAKSKYRAAYEDAIRAAGAHRTQWPDISMGAFHGAAPYEVVTDSVRAAEVINGLHGKMFAYDYETTSRIAHEAKIVGVALADENTSWYLAGHGLRALPELADLLCDDKSQPIAHNAKYEYKVGACNMHIEPTQMTSHIDTMIQHWVWTADYGNGLKQVARKLLGVDVLEFEDVVPKGALITDVPYELLGRYAAAGDARNTYDLEPILSAKLKEAGVAHIYEEYERPLTPVLAEMELEGFYIDRGRLGKLLVEYVQERDRLAASLHHMGLRCNPSQAEGVAKWLYDELGAPKLALTKGGRPSLAREVRDKVLLSVVDTLDKLTHGENVGDILSPYAPTAIKVYGAWSKAEKLINTFLLPTYASGVTRIFFNLNQSTTATGRLSSSEPNVQNWPMAVRDIVIPPPGEIITARDFNQLEPRVAAIASQDEKMLYAYTQPVRLPNGDLNPDADPYIQLGIDMGFDYAKVMAKEKATRTTIKAVFLGWMYGSGPGKMQETAMKADVVLSIREMAYFKRMLEETRPAFVHWRDMTIQAARDAGGKAYDLLGRYRYVKGLFSRDPQERSEAERQAVNMVPQGTNAGIIKKVMPRVHKLYKSAKGRLVNQIHDELVGHWSQEAEDELGHEAERIMTDYDWIPLRVESASGPTWLKAKP